MTKQKSTSGNDKIFTHHIEGPFFIRLDLEKFNISINKSEDKTFKRIEGPSRDFKPETTISELNAIIDELLKLSFSEMRKANKMLN